MYISKAFWGGNKGEARLRLRYQVHLASKGQKKKGRGQLRTTDTESLFQNFGEIF